MGMESLKGDVLELARIIKNGKKLMGEEVLSMKSKLLELIDQSNKTQKKNRILRTLEFEQMRRRKAQIQPSFPKTFDWAHHVPEADDEGVRRIKACFRDWLSGEDGVFWVAGKPGSGKSTFMKFLGEAGKEHTERALKKWGGPARVLTAYYFFWIEGMPFQRSREGMLRSLLFDILRQAPGLIPSALPSQWDADDHDYHPSEELWDLGELTQAFKNIVSQKEEPVKVCLFVDGLDEFDARNPSVGLKDLLNLTRDLGGFSGMKLCMSSRMWQEFEDHFHHNPWKLHLHDLTKKDVEWLIRERMCENERFRRLREEDPLGCEELFAGIASRAKGVILWVVLVVRQLLTEVDKAGEMDDLRKELQRIPPELKDYFRLMLERIEHKSEAARVLRVTSEAVEPLSMLAFHFLEKEWDNHDFVDQLGIFPISDEELRRIHERVPKRLDKYAKDLLQVQPVDVKGDSFLSHRVEFLHRTVVDFLRSEEVAKDIEKLSTKDEPDFDPAVSLCKISLALVKSLELPNGLGETCKAKRLNSFFALVDQVMFYAGAAEQRKPSRPQVSVLDELDRSNSRRTSDIGVHWTNRREPAKGLLQEYGGSSFLALAIQMNLRLYVAEKLDRDPTLMRSKQNRPFLDYALRPNIITPLLGNRLQLLDKDQPLDTKMVSLLLDRGADPNQQINIYDFQTPWSLFLTKCYEKHAEIQKQKLVRKAWYDAFVLLLENGADFDRNCITYVARPQGQRPKETKMRVDEIITHAFTADEVADLQSLVDTKRREAEAARRQGLMAWTMGILKPVLGF